MQIATSIISSVCLPFLAQLSNVAGRPWIAVVSLTCYTCGFIMILRSPNLATYVVRLVSLNLLPLFPLTLSHLSRSVMSSSTSVPLASTFSRPFSLRASTSPSSPPSTDSSPLDSDLVPLKYRGLAAGILSAPYIVHSLVSRSAFALPLARRCRKCFLADFFFLPSTSFASASSSINRSFLGTRPRSLRLFRTTRTGVGVRCHVSSSFITLFISNFFPLPFSTGYGMYCIIMCVPLPFLFSAPPIFVFLPSLSSSRNLNETDQTAFRRFFSHRPAVMIPCIAMLFYLQHKVRPASLLPLHFSPKPTISSLSPLHRPRNKASSTSPPPATPAPTPLPLSTRRNKGSRTPMPPSPFFLVRRWRFFRVSFSLGTSSTGLVFSFSVSDGLSCVLPPFQALHERR
jgi:hypothetical protein